MQARTIKEVAEILRVSRATLYALCAQGKLPHIRVGTGRGAIRIRDEDLTAFIESCEVQSLRKNAVSGLKHIKTPST
jgi:excisionase family DNA binding protein